MTSLYPVTQSYFLQTPTVVAEKIYRKGNLMSYLLKAHPLFAHLVIRARMDDFLDSNDFHGTVFVPFKEYSDKHFEYFQDIDPQIARDIVTMSILPNIVSVDVLQTLDRVPTLNKYNDLQVSIGCKGNILLNDCTLIQCSGLLNNGMVYVLNGLLSPRVRV